MDIKKIEDKINNKYNILYTDNGTSLQYLGKYNDKYLFGLIAADKNTNELLDNFYILSDDEGNLTEIIENWINDNAYFDTEFYKIENEYKYFETNLQMEAK
jgi:hypothetical protein